MRILIILLCLSVFNNPLNKDEDPKDIEVRRCYHLDKDQIHNYPLAEILAAVAYHECYNLSKLERWLVMEAFMNRVRDNFNNNGQTVVEQILAPKQFTGLWLDERFIFDSFDTLCIQNLEMAKQIISGVRVCNKTIYYWAGLGDRKTGHGRFVKKDRKMKFQKLKHWFR